MKHLARELPMLFKDDEQIKLTHSLNDNWQKARPYIVKLNNYLDEDNTAILFVDKVLKDFLEFDPSGEVFRFPENRKGNLHLQDSRIINVEILGAHMTKLADIFEFWFYKTSNLFKYREGLSNDT